MPGYLLDTSVVSALAPGKPVLTPEIGEWLRGRADRLFLPAVAVAEIEQGLCKLRRLGGAAKAEALAGWLERLLFHYGGRVLPLDAAVARLAGRIADQAVAAGQHPGFADVAIAAIASHHGLLLLTRNIRHFAALGVAHHNPFEAGALPV